VAESAQQHSTTANRSRIRPITYCVRLTVSTLLVMLLDSRPTAGVDNQHLSKMATFQHAHDRCWC